MQEFNSKDYQTLKATKGPKRLTWRKMNQTDEARLIWNHNFAAQSRSRPRTKTGTRATNHKPQTTNHEPRTQWWTRSYPSTNTDAARIREKLGLKHSKTGTTTNTGTNAKTKATTMQKQHNHDSKQAQTTVVTSGSDITKGRLMWRAKWTIMMNETRSGDILSSLPFSDPPYLQHTWPYMLEDSSVSAGSRSLNSWSIDFKFRQLGENHPKKPEIPQPDGKNHRWWCDPPKTPGLENRFHIATVRRGCGEFSWIRPNEWN